MSVMISISYKGLFSLLADGTVCQCAGYYDPIHPRRTAAKGIATIAGLVDRNELVALTCDGLFSRYTLDSDTLEDITDYVCNILEKPLDEIVREILVAPGAFAVRTDYIVGIVRYSYARITDDTWYDEPVKTVTRYTFQHRVNLVSIGVTYGLIRTDGGCLYFVGEPPFLRVRSNEDRDPTLIVFPGSESVCEIICERNYVLLLLLDGRVYAGGHRHGRNESECWFNEVQFGKQVSIMKIVTHMGYTFYIADDGSHYYVNAREPMHQDHTRPPSRTLETLVNNRGLHPHPIKALQGYCVENAFILNQFIVIIHNTDRVCIIPILHRDDPETGAADPMTYKELTVTHLIFPGAVPVISVTDHHNQIYFTAATGQVYCGAITDRMYDWLIARTFDSAGIRRIEFFDENPVAVSPTARMIASTASMLNDS